MPPEAADPAVTRERGARRRVVLFVGWQRGFESLLRLLDARLPPGSEVYILSEQSERARTLELNAEGLSLDGSPTGDEGGEKGLVNCRLEHVYGYTTDERAMRRLPLARADAAVVVADTNEDDAGAGLGEGGGGAELQIADSEALTSTILLRRLHAEISLGQKDAPTLTIVTEFVDLLTRRLLERQGSLITRAPAPRSSPSSGAAVMKVEAVEGDGASSGGGGEVQPVVFHRNYIETTALSLASHSATSWLTVQMLLDPHSGYAIASVRVGDAAALPGSQRRRRATRARRRRCAARAPRATRLRSSPICSSGRGSASSSAGGAAAAARSKSIRATSRKPWRGSHATSSSCSEGRHLTRKAAECASRR